jgi:tritrans,polycis-undecaprenyl-diphosphate synthase [geranylgeranyl-diphosphate specific]
VAQNNNFHVGMIPDGNRRWARERGLQPWEGHQKGAEKGEMFIEWCIDHPEVYEITTYGLSEENFKRPPLELDKLYEIYEAELTKILTKEKIHTQKVRIYVIATNPRPLPFKLLRLFRRMENETRTYDKKVLNMLVGYTGQSEILEAVSTTANRIKNLLFGLSRSDLQNGLKIKRPCDFIIRTGEESEEREARSGFLLWQSAYAEYYHINKYFPDLTPEDLDRSWVYFKSTRRKMGL